MTPAPLTLGILRACPNGTHAEQVMYVLQVLGDREDDETGFYTSPARDALERLAQAAWDILGEDE